MKNTTKKVISAAMAILMFSSAFAAKKAAVLIPGTFIRGADLSCLYDIEKNGAKFTDTDGTEKDMLSILRSHGANWIRLRIWVNPESENSSLYNYGMCTMEKAAAIGKRAKELDFNILLDLQFSDTWASMDNQRKPAEWDTYITERLYSEVKKHTRTCLETMKNAGFTPDMIQLGNEINKGLLLTTSKNEHATINGKLGSDTCQQILNTAIECIRDFDSGIQIMLHFALGGNKEEIQSCMDKVNGIDYSWIGLSYYPFYLSNGTHENLGETIKYVASRKKNVVVVETSFPWTCDVSETQHDSVQNTVTFNGEDGSMMQVYENLMTMPNLAMSSHNGKKIIRPSKINQKNYLEELKKVIYSNGGKGFFYWGGDWVYTDEKDPARGSTWENQALFDLDHKANSVVEAFGN